MHPVLVADTSIIIDLSRGGILDAAFRTRFVVTVPDLLYSRSRRRMRASASREVEWVGLDENRAL